METYNDFINNIINTRGRFNCDGYHERHHIKPKCLDGSNDSDNLVDLYAREHFIAHKLLVLENPNNKDLVYAWHCMSVMKNEDMKRYELTPEEYEELRISFSYSMSGEGNPMYGKHFSDDSKRKMSENHVDISGANNPMYGAHHSEETRQRISESKIGRSVNKGIPKSKEQCLRMSRARQGKYMGEDACNKKAVYCIELNMLFATVKIGAEYVGIDRSCISSYLHDKQKSAGKHPSTNESLHWLYLEDAIKLGYITQQND